MILQAKDPNINVKLKPWDREVVFGFKDNYFHSLYSVKWELFRH